MRAQAVFRLARKIAPMDRVEWIAAMAAEAEHVPDDQRFQFAFGCLIAAVHSRITSTEFIQTIARGVLIGGGVFWVLLNIRFAGRVTNTGTPDMRTFVYCMAAIFATGTLLTARSGFKAVLRLGIPFIGALGTAALTVRLGWPSSPTSNLYLALIAEDIVVMLIALLIALATLRLISARGGPAQ